MTKPAISCGAAAAGPHEIARAARNFLQPVFVPTAPTAEGDAVVMARGIARTQPLGRQWLAVADNRRSDR